MTEYQLAINIRGWLSQSMGRKKWGWRHLMVIGTRDVGTYVVCACVFNVQYVICSEKVVIGIEATIDFEFITGWWFGKCLIFPFSWEFHHPNWLSIFFRGVGIPPTRFENGFKDRWNTYTWAPEALEAHLKKPHWEEPAATCSCFCCIGTTFQRFQPHLCIWKQPYNVAPPQ